MKKLLLIFILTITTLILAQPYQGPDTGSVPSGVQINTSLMLSSGTPLQKYFKPPRNTIVPAPLPDPANLTPAALYGKPLYTEDPIIQSNKSLGTDTLVQSFAGIPDQGYYIPPDPYMAVSPDYILATVNSRFRILTRTGTMLRQFEADTWYGGLISNPDAFDPKVIYDHFSKRWVMVWLHAVDASNANFLVSVSDDSIPLGIWYNYKLPSTKNGNNASLNWSDYQGVGYDENAIYLTGNQFNSSGYFDYCKIRIIPKSLLYANTGGMVKWTDIWNIYEPNGNPIFGLRPVRNQTSSSNKFYFVAHSRYTTGTFFTICELSNPLTNPTMTVTNVPVGAYYNPANAQQLGSSNLIDGGGLNLRNEPIFKDGKIYLAHSIQNGSGSAVRYLKLDAYAKTTEEDLSLGASNYFHYYPAIGVDKMSNVVITYTRSSSSEYAGAFYTVKEATSPTLTASKLLQAGLAPYYKTFGGSRNRWGDYMGAWTDPLDFNSVWIFTEYAGNSNMWGTWIGRVQVSGTGTTCKDISVNSGWNIVSVPVGAATMTPSGVFPTATSAIYGYENNYVVTDTLKNGKGYWVKFANAGNVQVCGNVIQSTTIPVSAGWNLIGGYDRSIPTSLITSNPPNIITSVFYGYNNLYQVADSLLAGKGYWVKASQSGNLIVPTVMAKSSFNHSDLLKDLPYIQIRDNSGQVSKLYLCENSNFKTDMFELPPVAPNGNFEARFSSNKMVEIANSKLQIILNSAEYPLTLIPNGISVKLDGENTLVNSGESFTLQKNSLNTIDISVENIPSSFSLLQNYPNPFNPVTKISYEIPNLSNVSLVTLRVYDVLGRLIETIVNENQKPGKYSVDWNGTNHSSGIYYYELQVGDYKAIKKMTLMK